MIGKNEFKNFEENEILCTKDCGTMYVFQLNGKKGYQCFIYNQLFRKDNDKNYNWNDYIVEKATELEKAWLKECIKQNKFVPLENIKLIQNDWLWTI